MGTCGSGGKNEVRAALDLSGILIDQLGLVTKDLNRRWDELNSIYSLHDSLDGRDVIRWLGQGNRPVFEASKIALAPCKLAGAAEPAQPRTERAACLHKPATRRLVEWSDTLHSPHQPRSLREASGPFIGRSRTPGRSTSCQATRCGFSDAAHVSEALLRDFCKVFASRVAAWRANLRDPNPRSSVSRGGGKAHRTCCRRRLPARPVRVRRRERRRHPQNRPDVSGQEPRCGRPS